MRAALARLLPIWLLLACTACSTVDSRADANQTRTGASAEVHALTGTHARVVWVQHDGRDPFAQGSSLVLMGLDTDDGRGERAILGEPGSYVKPLFTPRGDRIVYSTSPLLPEPGVYVVNFDGTGRRRLEPGLALTVWEDPADGGAWVYIGTDHREYNVTTVTRVRLDDPSRRELVSSGPQVSFDTLQLSPDGKTAGGLFPWPVAGVVDIAAGKMRRFGEGCWTALNDAGALLFWYFDGSHRNLLMADVRSDRRWTVAINRAPGFENPEVYHPRWSRHPRFMAMSGPYDQGGANQVRSGGAQSEIWMGRFAADYTTIEQWARVSHNAKGDSYPDVWIDAARSPHPVRASGRVGPLAGSAARVDPGRLVVEAKLVATSGIPEPASIAPYRHALVVNGYDIVRVIEGDPTGDRLAVAEWAIRDARVIAGAERAIGEVRRLVVERYEAHPELEGERVIQGRGVPNLPLYVEVQSTTR
jgi:hypothetical protein